MLHDMREKQYSAKAKSMPAPPKLFPNSRRNSPPSLKRTVPITYRLDPSDIVPTNATSLPYRKSPTTLVANERASQTRVRTTPQCRMGSNITDSIQCPCSSPVSSVSNFFSSPESMQTSNTHMLTTPVNHTSTQPSHSTTTPALNTTTTATPATQDALRDAASALTTLSDGVNLSLFIAGKADHEVSSFLRLS